MYNINSAAHTKRGLKKVLESPSFFNFWQRITGAEAWKKRIISEYVKPISHARILDIGCGTGSVLKYIDKNTNVDYVGCDINSNYIRHAKEKYNGKGSFYCCSANNLPSEESGFDIILAIAILHHLDDATSINLINSAKRKLKQEGFFFIAEPAWTENQSGLEKYLMKNDRGKNIKTEKEYLAMVKNSFSSMESKIICDSHFIPWTVNVILCKNSV